MRTLEHEVYVSQLVQYAATWCFPGAAVAISFFFLFSLSCALLFCCFSRSFTCFKGGRIALLLCTRPSRPHILNHFFLPAFFFCSSDEARASLSTQRVSRNCESYLAMVEAFAAEQGTADARAELAMPSTLTSAQRRLVHQRADELGLGHGSRSVGRERYIVLTRPA